MKFQTSVDALNDQAHDEKPIKALPTLVIVSLAHLLEKFHEKI